MEQCYLCSKNHLTTDASEGGSSLMHQERALVRIPYEYAADSCLNVILCPASLSEG